MENNIVKNYREILMTSLKRNLVHLGCDGVQLLVWDVEDLLYELLLLLQRPGHLLVLPPQLLYGRDHGLGQQHLVRGVHHNLAGVDQLPTDILKHINFR